MILIIRALLGIAAGLLALIGAAVCLFKFSPFIAMLWLVFFLALSALAMPQFED